MHPLEDTATGHEETAREKITRIFRRILELVTGKTHTRIQNTLAEDGSEEQLKVGDEVLFFDREKDALRGKILKIESGYVTVQTGQTERRLVPEKELINHTKTIERKELTETLRELFLVVRAQSKWYPQQKRYINDTLPPAIRTFFQKDNYDALFFTLIEVMNALYPPGEFDTGISFNPAIDSLDELRDIDMECFLETPEYHVEPYIDLTERTDAIDASDGDDVLLLIKQGLKLTIQIYKQEKLVH